MSFFYKDIFALSSLSDDVDVVTDGNGNVSVNTVDETLGIQTYANADAAFIVSDAGITHETLRSSPVRISFKYKITSLQASDVFTLFLLVG